MANKTLTTKISMTYTDGDDVQRTTSRAVATPYTSMIEGSLDVPDTTAAATVYAVPFGSIAKATGVLIANKTSSSLKVKRNAEAVGIASIAPGGVELLAIPAQDASEPVTAIELVTTDLQTGDGEIEFKVFGDPV